MVLKLAGKRYNYEFLLVNFLDIEGGEQTLFEEAIEDIDSPLGLFFQNFLYHSHSIFKTQFYKIDIGFQMF